MEKVPVTRQGYDALNAELKTLKEETRPAVIKAIAEAVDGIAPRDIPKSNPRLRLSGLELFESVAQ